VTDPSRAARLRHAQDQVRAQQAVVDMLKRDLADMRADLNAKLHELAEAELRRAEAVVVEARVFAETEGAQGR